MAWNRSAKSIMDELRVGVDDLRKKSARKLLTELHALSPIKSGRYRSNHLVSIGTPSTAYDARRTNYTRWFTENMNTINRSPFGASIFIQQNLPYNRRIEDGSSTQAPTGVYKIAVMRVKLS